MPKFRYTAKDKDGKLVHGVIERQDQDETITALQSKGLVVVSISSTGEKAAPKTVAKKLRSGLKSEDLTLFCRQTATLLNAGVTLLRGLSIVLKQMDSKPLYFAVDKVRSDVEDGSSLHDAMAKHPRIFSPLWVSLIEIGEVSGQLTTSFEHLASYLEKSNAVARKVKSAMTYPIILLIVCIVAILIFTLKIIPMFGDIYKGFNIELPGLTMVVLKISKFTQKYIILMAAAAVGSFFALKNFYRTRSGRHFFDTLILKVPIFGSLIKSMIIERFAYTLGLLIKSGIPLLSGLDTVANVCDNKIFEKVIYSVKEDVRSGKTMSAPLEDSGVFPMMVTQMISVGEETGKLSEMLDRVSIYYQENINAMVDRMTATFEPLLLIFMGSTVGVLVIAMYLPIFKIATGVGTGPGGQ